MESKLPSPLIPYETYLTIEKIGSIPLHIEALKDLDKALDEICTRYDPKNPEEEQRLLDLCPYFGLIWPSARALGIFMSERKSLFSKKNGIEVGCGLALPSIIAAKIGAQVLATDFHPDVSTWVTRNAELNHVKIPYRYWDWTSDDFGGETFDFVLASDVLYESRHPEDLAKALARIVSATGSIYLSDPGRAYLRQALEEFEKLGFHCSRFEYEVEESSHRAELRLEKKRTVQVFEFKMSI